MASKRIRRRFLTPVVNILTAVCFPLVQILPLAVNHMLARSIGVLIYCMPWARKLVVANLAIAFPDWNDRRRKAVARRSLQNVCRSYLEFVWYLARQEHITAYVEFSDTEQRKYHDKCIVGKGSILITPHIGNFELGHLASNAHGIVTGAVAARITNPNLARKVTAGRTGMGAEIIDEKGAAKMLLRRLRNGQDVALLVDQNTRPRRGGIYVDFFGLPVPVTRAPAMFARRTGAPVFVCACVRDESDRLRMQVHPLPRNSTDYASDAELTQEINAITETIIRETPDQYLWLYRRWRYIPPDFDAAKRGSFPYYAKVHSGKQDREQRRQPEE